MSNKSSFHWRNDSGELDVFEAAGYFSNAVDQAAPPYRHHTFRRSLDAPIMIRSNPIPLQTNHHNYTIDQKQLIKDQNKKLKQPISPGGRLASFLNSLFNQTSLKKKKPKPELEEESSKYGRRKRRSSISHFRITTAPKTTAPAPPLYANTPIKSYRELARFAEHRVVSVGEKKGVESEKRGLRKWSEEDDGGESDSSSDLFDLPINHDLDFFSTGLPVYGTTRIETITIAKPIPSAM